MSRHDPYGDGLDADGYPLPVDDRPRYVRGSEADAGDFKPIGLGAALANVLDRVRIAAEVAPSADSPIETILGAAILLAFEKSGKPLVLANAPVDNESRLQFVPQFRWSIYRSDWAIYNPKTTGALLIECDGKEFHSSPEQLAHDERKDNAARDRGFLTLRFTGRRIHLEADKCAADVFGLVYGGRK